jgi:hypothetical protein
VISTHLIGSHKPRKHHRKNADLSFAGRLDYQRTLTCQKIRAPYCVIYNQSGTNIAASIVTTNEFDIIGKLKIRGYVIDSKTYYHYPKSEEEAHYLVGILNTSFVNEAIKPLQPEGLMGARDIHRRPFEACNIPIFDPKNLVHQRIAKIAAAAREELLLIVPKMESSAGTARGDTRHLVQGKLNQLDTIVSKLLNGKVAHNSGHKYQSMKLQELF